MRTTMIYVGLAAAIALVSGAVMTSYNVSRGGLSMSGVIVRHDEAALEVEDQPAATDSLKIDRVVAPGPAWIVVTQVIMGKGRGMDDTSPVVAAPMPVVRVLGKVHVDRGETFNVRVPFDPSVPKTRMVLVVLHADRGTAGAYEFDMKRFAESPDKPYYRMSQDGIYTPVQLGMQVMAQPAPRQ